MNFVRSFVNYAIFRELCDRMRFEVDCAKSHHRVMSEGLLKTGGADDDCSLLGHVNTFLARGGGNLNDPIFKSSKARGGEDVEVSN